MENGAILSSNPHGFLYIFNNCAMQSCQSCSKCKFSTDCFNKREDVTRDWNLIIGKRTEQKFINIIIEWQR